MGERLAFTFALTGRREWGHGTQGVAPGYGLAGLSARAGPHNRLLRRSTVAHFACQVSYSAAPQPSPNVRAAPLVVMSLRYLTKNIAEFL